MLEYQIICQIFIILNQNQNIKAIIFIQLIQMIRISNRTRSSIQQSNSNRLASVFPQFVLILALIGVCSSLTLHNQPEQHQQVKEYNQAQYLNSLTSLQNRYKTDITNIQSQFVNINLKLNNTNISSSSKFVYLQETLAEERDSLYKIQTYLNTPYALRSCQCVNLTADQKASIAQSINDVSKNISALQASITTDASGTLYENPACKSQQCLEVRSLQQQVRNMQNYVKIMNDTITSECCKIINYYYRDNLANVNTWFYGNTTEKNYRLALYERAKLYNLTKCPSSAPYANLTINKCFPCPSNLPYFNVGARVCVAGCSNAAFIINTTSHICDYNRTCPSGQSFNDLTGQCEKILGVGTNSWCPPSVPYWNQATLACQKCPSATPFYDYTLTKCRACIQNQTWNSDTSSCDPSSPTTTDCPAGQQYNQDTQSCEKIQDTSQGTSTSCPPQTPYWSSQDYACHRCPSATPYFNQITLKCSACSAGTTWNVLSQNCQSPNKCPVGTTFNSLTQKCQTDQNPNPIQCGPNQVYDSVSGTCVSNNQNGQLGLCPPDLPYWNNNQMICTKCPSSQPLWNANTRQCQPCPVNTIWNQQSQTCTAPTPVCNGQILNPTTNQCENCPVNTTFNAVTKTCDQIIVPGTGTNTSSCTPDQPVWNPQRLNCEPCPTGQTWVPVTQSCAILIAKTTTTQNATTTQNTTATTTTHRHNLKIQDKHQESPEHTEQKKVSSTHIVARQLIQ